MRKRRVSTHSYCAPYIPIHHTQGSRNRHGWIDQATCLLLRRRRAQAFVRVNQQVSKFYISDSPRIYVSLTRPRFRRWGVVSFADSLDCVGIVSKDVTSASKLFGSSLSRPPFSSGIYQRRQQDVLSVFDENDPTAARPTTREKARELCSEHMSEWASSSNSNSGGDLSKLRIGIPQVWSASSNYSI